MKQRPLSIPQYRTMSANVDTLRKGRIAKGWTIAELATKSKLSVKAVKSAARGNPVYLSTITKIANALSLDVEALLSPIPTPSESPQAQQVVPPSSQLASIVVTFELTCPYDAFNESDDLVTFIRMLVRVIKPKHDIEVISVKRGSTIVAVSMAPEDAETLLRYYQTRGIPCVSTMTIDDVTIDPEDVSHKNDSALSLFGERRTEFVDSYVRLLFTLDPIAKGINRHAIAINGDATEVDLRSNANVVDILTLFMPLIIAFVRDCAPLTIEESYSIVGIITSHLAKEVAKLPHGANAGDFKWLLLSLYQHIISEIRRKATTKAVDDNDADASVHQLLPSYTAPAPSLRSDSESAVRRWKELLMYLDSKKPTCAEMLRELCNGQTIHDIQREHDVSLEYIKSNLATALWAGRSVQAKIDEAERAAQATISDADASKRSG